MNKAREIVNMAQGNDALDEENNKSLYNLLRHDNKLLQRLKDAPVANLIIKGLNEQDFRERFGHDRNYKTLRRLRHQFWNEFNITVSSKAEFMPASRIYSGIVSRKTFSKLMDDDLYAAFVLTQPQDVSLIQTDLLYEGYRHLEEVLELPIKSRAGEVDNKLISHKINIIKLLEDRKNGSVVQRTHGIIENSNGGGESQPKSEDDYRDLKAEVAALRKEMGKKDIEDAHFTEVK